MENGNLHTFPVQPERTAKNQVEINRDRERIVCALTHTFQLQRLERARAYTTLW